MVSKKSKKSGLVVMAAGRATQDFTSVFNATTPAMLPFNGRPLIYQIIINHIKNFSGNVIIALPEGDGTVERFVRNAFENRTTLDFVYIDHVNQQEPMQTLTEVLRFMARNNYADCPMMIAHGDIYYELNQSLPQDRPAIFVDQYIDSDKYSVFDLRDHPSKYIEANQVVQNIEKLTDKAKIFTDIGVYWVPSWQELKNKAKDQGTQPLVGMTMHSLYHDTVDYLNISAWRDLGHVDTATKINTKLVGAREFNSLVVDEHRGLITKRSRKNQKILQEINYYLKLPKELLIYFPRLYDFNIGKNASYSTEYYGYRTLSEYFVFYEFPKTTWRKIIEKVMLVHKEFSDVKRNTVSVEDAYNFYTNKLYSRLEDLDTSTELGKLLMEEEVKINGKRIKGWKFYKPFIEQMVKAISANCQESIIHGDMCFSNILYDPQTGLVKFIDPRGEFFDEGCYGDARYDLAKLLHSFHGGYDFIIHQMYQLKMVGDGEYSFSIIRPESSKQASLVMLDLIEKNSGFDISELIVMEAMLFLSMLPLHSDDTQRQLAFYLIALHLLQEAYSCNQKDFSISSLVLEYENLH